MVFYIPATDELVIITWDWFLRHSYMESADGILDIGNMDLNFIDSVRWQYVGEL